MKYNNFYGKNKALKRLKRENMQQFRENNKNAYLNGVQEAAGSTPVTRTNMNSRHSVAAVFSFRRKGTGGKFKFATDLPDIVLICALQQNRQKKHTNLQTFTICRVNKMWYNTSRRGQLQGRFPLCRYCVPRCGLQFGRICPTKYNCTARISSVRCSFLMYSMA